MASESKSLHFKRLNERNIALIQEDKMTLGLWRRISYAKGSFCWQRDCVSGLKGIGHFSHESQWRYGEEKVHEVTNKPVLVIMSKVRLQEITLQLEY